MTPFGEIRADLARMDSFSRDLGRSRQIGGVVGIFDLVVAESG
jgi:hypothetical protein